MLCGRYFGTRILFFCFFVPGLYLLLHVLHVSFQMEALRVVRGHECERHNHGI